MDIILASSSKYRSQVLVKSGVNAKTFSPDIDESSLTGESPHNLVARLSILKAKKAGQHFSNHLIIGSDQVADFGGKVIGKPGNFNNAKKQLEQLQGETVTFRTGLSLLNSESGIIQTEVNTTRVTYRELSETEIHSYLEQDRPFDCAGSFKSEGLGITILDKIEGTDPNSLIGLPMITLLRMLRKEGYNPLMNY